MVAGVVDADFNLLETRQAPTKGTRPFTEVVQSMAEVAQQALAAAGLTEADIDYVGLGVPSTVNPVTKRLAFANNLGWKDVDIEGEFQKYWNVPVELGNDADCAALGEVYAGVAKAYSSAILFTLGTGVGGGIVLNNKLFLGGDGLGIEPGHSLLIYDGFPCTCGRRGCLEAYASVTALIRETIDMMLVHPHSLMWDECGRDLNRVNGRTSFNAAKKGDEAGTLVVQQYINYLAEGIASLVTVFRPEAVIIGGGVSNEGDYLIKPLYDIVSKSIYAGDVLGSPPILKAKLGNSAGIIGAAILGAQPK